MRRKQTPPYSLALVRAKLAEGCTTVIMRQATNWLRLVPGLQGKAFTVNNPQSKSLSPAGERRRGNLSTDAAAAIEASLRAI